MEKKINYSTPDELWGSAITYTRIDEEGRMFVGNDEYESQVNFCPITGEPAHKKMTLKETNSYGKQIFE
jgi:hypothetical protein